jgi:hypothetical protein
MSRSANLAAMSTRGLRDEREADLLLTTDAYAGTERVKEYHADRADRISDELDRRTPAIRCPYCYSTDGHHAQCPHF